MRTRLACLMLALPLVALAGGSAHAQYYNQPAPPPPPGQGGPHRMGFEIGFALGGGVMGCSSCVREDSLNGLALELHLGGMVTPNLAVEFDGSTVVHFFPDSQGGGTFSSNFGAVAIRFWPMRFLWLKGGLGFGYLQSTDASGVTTDTSETGFGLLGAVGVELLQTRSFALDVQLRANSTKYSNVTIYNAGLLIGFNWY